MKARDYDKRIEVWETGVPIPDGFGGYSVGSIKISSSWTKVQTEGLGRKAYNMGIVEFNDPILFLVRGRIDLPYNGRNLYIMYRNQKYIIQGIKNADLRDVDTEIFCTKEEQVEVPLIGVIPG